MSTGTNMNQEIISFNLDMVEKQRRSIHCVLDEYVDQVITAGRQWTISVERNQSSFVKVHKIITKALEFLSLKCDEVERKHFSCLRQETSKLIGKDEFSQQQKHVPMDSGVDITDDFSVAKPITTHTQSTEDDSNNIRHSYTCREPNLERDQRARNEDFYNQLQNILEKQDGLDQQVNMKFNELREEMESLKLNVDQINTDLSAKVGEVSTDFSAKVKTIKTDLSHKVNQIKTDLSDKVDEIDKELSAKFDKINTELLDKADRINIDNLSDKIDEITTELSEKVDEINTELSEKIDEINTELSEKVDQIYTDRSKNADNVNFVLETLSNSQQERAAQINKIVDLENHFNTVEKDLHNNVRQVENKLAEVESNYSMIRELFVSRLAPLEKLQDILNERATSQSENARQLQAVMAELKDLSNVVETCARKSAEVVGFNAETMFSPTHWERSCVCPFQSPRLISGCQFDSTTGKFTAVVGGFYLVYISLCIKHFIDDGGATIYLIHGEKSQEHSVQICLAKAETRHIPVFNLAMVEMKVDDELFMMIDGRSSFWGPNRNSPLNCVIQFSCLRFG